VCTDAPGAHWQQSVVSLRSRDGYSKYTVSERLRSADTNRYEPLTTRLKFGERYFSHAGPKAWNALPAELQDLMDHGASCNSGQCCLSSLETNVNTMCRMGLIRGRYFLVNSIPVTKLQNEITLKVPPGEWIYQQLCRLSARIC